MQDRSGQVSYFLKAQGLDQADRQRIAGDASNRKYHRITADGRTIILMDAPPERDEDVRPFVRMADYLRSVGLSAPEILAVDESKGFLLLEDLGDDLFARLIEKDRSLEPKLYDAAIDVLVQLHAAAPLDLQPYDAPTMTAMSALAFDWYQRGAVGIVDLDAKEGFCQAMLAQLGPLDIEKRVVIQRDYHAENLIWLPDRSGAARVGLLDFQDAMLGHPAYDLVSVLQDARRDVSAQTAKTAYDRYLEATAFDRKNFARAYALLGLQRNLRILGVFARLSLVYGKPNYIDLIPQVWAHIETNLHNPCISHLKPCLETLPPPTDDILQSLKNQCATLPLP